MEKSKIFVFDADDTLWENGAFYSCAQAKNFAYIYEILGNHAPDLHTLKDKYFEIAATLFEEFGVRHGRIEREMLLTFQWACEFAQKRSGKSFCITSEHLKKIHEFGEEPFEYWRLEWLPEVKTFLTILIGLGHKICLLTSYDKVIFPTRAEFLELYNYFEPKNIKIIEHKKTTEDFITVSGWTPENDKEHVWYAVGNADSDIDPALEISPNWRGIIIPFGTTSVYVGKVQKNNNPRVKVIDKITSDLHMKLRYDNF